MSGERIMTPVKAKLRGARDLVARLKVAHDPIARIELSRALKAAAEDLRDAIVAPSKQSKDVAPEANQAIVEEADGGSTMSTCELVYFVDHGDEYRRSPLFVSMSGDPEVL